MRDLSLFLLSLQFLVTFLSTTMCPNKLRHLVHLNKGNAHILHSISIKIENNSEVASEKGYVRLVKKIRL